MDKEYLNQIARDLEGKLPDGHGFILLSAPFSAGGGHLAYVSNMKREDAIVVLKEWLIQAGGAEEWMKHIK